MTQKNNSIIIPATDGCLTVGDGGARSITVDRSNWTISPSITLSGPDYVADVVRIPSGTSINLTGPASKPITVKFEATIDKDVSSEMHRQIHRMFNPGEAVAEDLDDLLPCILDLPGDYYAFTGGRDRTCWVGITHRPTGRYLSCDVPALNVAAVLDTLHRLADCAHLLALPEADYNRAERFLLDDDDHPFDWSLADQARELFRR